MNRYFKTQFENSQDFAEYMADMEIAENYIKLWEWIERQEIIADGFNRLQTKGNLLFEFDYENELDDFIAWTKNVEVEGTKIFAAVEFQK